MSSPRKTTTQRGYGHTHQQLRKAYIARLVDGQSCAQCWHDKRIHHPMYRASVTLLDLSHTRDRTAVIGLSWARCNRSEAATRGNKQRGQVKRRHSRIW